MIVLSVPDMSCGHCKATVERTITALDSAADVTVDLQARRVQVVTAQPAAALINALTAEGYPASLVTRS